MKKLYPFFSQNPLDRLDLTRKDTATCKLLKERKDSLFLLFYDSEIVLEDEKNNCFFHLHQLTSFDINDEETILLGKFQDIHYFAINLNKDTSLKKMPIREFAESDYLDEKLLGIIAQASAVINWHKSHQHCSICGNYTQMMHVGWRRDCLTCKREHFPKVDPVVIMLVTFGEYCLLGRGANFKKNRYSCLAGYMESGESIEDAARRELFEEAGVVGENVEYISSQPWPFPSTLMIGLHVKAKEQKLNLDPHEISDAKWVHKDDIKLMLNGDESFGFSIPPKIAIARNLLEYWVQCQ